MVSRVHLNSSCLISFHCLQCYSKGRCGGNKLLGQCLQPLCSRSFEHCAPQDCTNVSNERCETCSVRTCATTTTTTMATLAMPTTRTTAQATPVTMTFVPNSPTTTTTMTMAEVTATTTIMPNLSATQSFSSSTSAAPTVTVSTQQRTLPAEPSMQSDDTALIAGVVGGVVGLLLLVGLAVLVARNRRNRRAPTGTSSAALEPARASLGNYESLSAVHSPYDSSFLTGGAKTSSPSPTNYQDLEMHPTSNEYTNGAIQPI